MSASVLARLWWCRTSGPIPTFARHARSHVCECWNQRTTRKCRFQWSFGFDVRIGKSPQAGSERQIRCTSRLAPMPRLRQRRGTMKVSRHSLRLVAVTITLVMAWPSLAAAEIPAIAMRQRAEKKTFTDAEIIEGFLKTTFGAEFQLAGRVDRIRKYVSPVRVFADGNRADRKAQLAQVVADIARRVQHLDIAIVTNAED